MNRKKDAGYSLAILKILYDTGTIRAQDLASKIGLSEKTIRSKVHTADAFLCAHDMGSIELRPHVGVVLNQDAKQRRGLSSFLKSHLPEDTMSDTNRMNKTLKLILLSAKEKTGITTQKIADQLYLSVPTTQKIIKDCEEWLKAFDISLMCVRKKGLVMKGSEENYRQALKEFIVSVDSDERPAEDLLYFLPGLNIDSIEKILQEVEKEWNFNFTDNSYSNILVYICVALYENLQGQKCLSLKYGDVSKNIEACTEFRFSRALYQRLNDHLGLAERPEEVGFLTVQILCSQVIENQTNNPQKMVQEYDEKLNDFVKKTISVVSEVMNVDMTKDETLYGGLVNHIRPLLFRLRYGVQSENIANVYVREKYISTLRVSWLISTLFEEYFHMSISDNELSYIALYIQSALDRNSRPMKAVLVSNLNMSISQLVTDKLIHHVSDIKECKILSTHEFGNMKHIDADLILTTTALDSNDSRILILPDPFADSNYDLIRDRITELKKNDYKKSFRFEAVCHSLFEPELMMTHVHYTDKKKLLKDMCAKLTVKGYAAPGYYQTVIAREEASTTSIGLGVAIPHGQMKYTNESKLVIATLDEPMDWGTEKVSAVFLLNILMKNENEINKWQEFYRQFIKLTESQENVKKLESFRNEIELYYFLIQ
jgi:transcriptional antiterminator/mannitol/fructose-specific phosphotransferase system IIA component (Ntr-type)